MAEKTYEIEIKTTANTEGVESVKSILSDTKEEVDSLNESTENLETTISDIDASPMEDLKEKTEESKESTDDASSSTENLGVSISSIDPSVIDQLRESMQGYNESAQEGADSTNDLMEGLVSGGVATGLGNTFMGLANSAGQYNDSMLRMGLALNGHAMTVEQVSEKYGASVSKMANETGRGAGSVRNHFANMGVAGVTNSEILEGSFQAIANGSFYSGESIEGLSNKFQRITMTGMLSAKQLSSLGLTMNDLASVMGVSADEVSAKFKEMSEEQRASVMATASTNKYGTEVNDVFKTSWEGLWTQLDKAKGGFERLVGELLLPYLIPAIQTASDIVNTLSQIFKTLPQPVKDVMGAFMVLGTAVTTAGLGLNAVFKIGKMVISPFQTIGKLMGVDLVGKAKTLASTLKGNVLGAFKSVGTFMKSEMLPALRNLGTSLLNVGKNALTSGYNALKSAGMWLVQKAQLIATHLWNGLVTISQWALNIAMSMNPIMLVVIAIGLLIGALAYLYFNNEQVKQAIDGLGQALWGIGEIIYGFLQQAWDFLITTLQNVWNYIITLGGLLPENVSITGNQIVDTIIRVMLFIATLPIQLGIILVNTIAKVLGFGDNFVQNMIRAGSNAVTNFINYISQIPSKLATELGNALNKVQEWASTLPQKFWEAGVNAVKQFLSALGINSPGTMQRMLVWEINEMGERVPRESRKLLSNVSDMGANIVDEFGNPSLQVSSAEVMNKSLSSQAKGTSATYNFYFNDTVVDNEERMEKICDYITKKISWNNETAGRTV